MKRSTTTKRTDSQRRALNRLRLFVVLAVLDVLLIVGILLMLPTALRSTDAAGKPKALFGVKGITVAGNTRYDASAIVGVSGIVEGQSVFSISKRTAEEYILNTFAYVKDVAIDVNSQQLVTISLTEHEELGAVAVGDSWMVVSREGVGLMKMPKESDRPLRRLYIKGVDILSSEIGARVIGGKDLSTAVTLVESMRANGLTGVGEIDLSNRSNIRLNWKGQMTIALGNDSNLNYEIAAAVSAIPRILSRHGDAATGLLNLSQYSDADIESPVVIFTPADLLNTDKPSDEPGEGGGTPENSTDLQEE